MKIYAVDIGSELSSKGRKNFAWACSDGRHGTTLSDFSDHLLSDLSSSFQISIGFECPLYFDAFDEKVNRQRLIDNGSSWTSSVGATSFATGLSQIYWILNSIVTANANVNIKILTDRNAIDDTVDIYIWEAFVTGAAKSEANSNRHLEDCKTALAHYICVSDEELVDDNKNDRECVSLIGALLLRVKKDISPSVLSERPLVFRPHQPYCKYSEFSWSESN